MIRKRAMRRLPVRFEPHDDELLSSWIGRHADFYGVEPITLLGHCLPDGPSLRAVNMQLGDKEAAALGMMFLTPPAVVRRMTFADTSRSSHWMIARRPLQRCSRCNPASSGVILKSELLGWRVTCPGCGQRYDQVDGSSAPSPFNRHCVAADRGERLLDDEALGRRTFWTSPMAIARLLLMRRIPRPLPDPSALSRYRVIGSIVPEFDRIAAASEELPQRANDILPLDLRPALLAGVAMIIRGGPEMLRSLRREMMGQNRSRFDYFVEQLVPAFNCSDRPTQLHLI